MSGMRRQKPSPSVVDAVAQQTKEAAGLARIEGQHRLASPHTNPAVRSHADQLRDDEHRRALNALHTRALRRHRVADNRAANAERALEAIQAARETSSAARSVLALHKGRTRFMGAALGASLTLSVGSAIGVAALAVKHGSPILIGYIAEVGLTGLATTVILYRSHLAQHGQKLEGWKNKVLWALMIGPLLASIVANALGTGGVGVACSVGAAAFSLLSYVMADASAEALQAKAKLVSETDELELRTIATGDEAGTQSADPIERTQVPSAQPLPIPDLLPARSETHEADLILSRSETHNTDQVPDLNGSQAQVSDPGLIDDSGPSSQEVSDPTGPEEVQVPEAQTGPKKKTRTRTSPLDRLDEAKAADASYLAERGRHIPAEKLARALEIGKPAALELVKQVRGAQMTIAK